MNLSSLASIFVNTILPVVFIAGIGFILARALALDARMLSRIALYFFIPALLFGQMYQAKLVSTIGSAISITILLGLLA